MEVKRCIVDQLRAGVSWKKTTAAVRLRRAAFCAFIPEHQRVLAPDRTLNPVRGGGGLLFQPKPNRAWHNSSCRKGKSGLEECVSPVHDGH